MTATYQQLTMEDIRGLVTTDFTAVDKLIATEIQSDVNLTKTICHHIIHSGGKRLRPLLVLLTAKALGYQGNQHITLATIIEFIHTATLLHDDVVDGSDMRRGKPSANQVWGNAASVLVGDFLYTRSFQLLTNLKNHNVASALANITNFIAEGEILQLSNRNRPEITEAEYMHIIQCKTAKLFESATYITSLLHNKSTRQEQEAMKAYGLHLGTAFQLIDDALDYTGNADELGKNIGDDLAEGKATLPLIYALQHASTDEAKAIIRDAITHGGLDNMPVILETINATKAIEHTISVAKAASKKAISELEFINDSPAKDALSSLALFSVDRVF